MITIEPLGGLGNQLFVYGIGLANARRLGTNLVVDRRNFLGYDWHSYELDSFHNEIFAEVTTENSKASRLLARLVRAVRRSGGRKFFSQTKNDFVDRVFGVVEEVDNHFDERFLRLKDNSRLRGYFQSWKYLEPVRDELRNSVSGVTQPSDWYLKKRAQLEAESPWIGVHVRLSNYIDLPSMGTVESRYYERALAILSDLGHNLPLIVFSDSPDLAREMELWSSVPNVTFLSNGADSRPIETLLLMSMADHLVIGNSTFSWWAGWLGEQRGRRVIYPRPWINNKKFDDRDLSLPDWIGIGREDLASYR